MSDTEHTGSFRRSDLPHRIAARLGKTRGDHETTAQFEARQIDEHPTATLIVPAPEPVDPALHTQTKRRLLRDTVFRPAIVPSPVPSPPPVGGQELPVPIKLNPERSLERMMAEPPPKTVLEVEAEIIPLPKPRHPDEEPTPILEPIHPRRRRIVTTQMIREDLEGQRRQMVGTRPARTQSRFNGIDWVLFFAVTIIEIVELYTMVNGARQLVGLLFGLAFSIGVLSMLWLYLTGIGGKNTPGIVRFGMIFGLSCIVMYFSIFTYYSHTGDEQRTMQANTRAHEEHSKLVASLFTERQTTAASLRKQASDKFEQAEREAAGRGRTGQKGYGPWTERLKAESDDLSTQAAALEATVTLLEPLTRPTDTSPQGLLEADQALWSATPAEWRASVPMPERTVYIDETMETALLLPVRGLINRDENLMLAAMFSVGVSGAAIVAGYFIEHRKRVPLLERITRWGTSLIVSVKTLIASFSAAWNGEGKAEWLGHDEDER